MNRKLLAIAVAGVVAPMTAQALDVSVSGQVNRAIRFADNGANSDVQHVEGAASGSRFRFTASGEVAPGIVAGAKIEQGFSVGAVDIDAKDADKPEAVNFRESYLYFGGDFGTVTMGWTYPAGNGIEFTSYSGATAGTQFGVASNTGISVRTDEGESAGSITDFFPSVTIGRQNTLRYDTPSIGPVTFAGSVQKDDETGQGWSFQGNVNHDVGGTSVTGGIALLEDDRLALGGAIQFPQGTSLQAAWGKDDSGTKDLENRYVNVSHTWGNTSVALGYRNSDDSSTGMEGQAIGLGVNQDFGTGVSVYAGFNNYSFDKPGDDLEDINAFHIGSLVKFN